MSRIGHLDPSRRLKYLSSVRFSNVDKKSVDEEQPVLLCNYTDVYYNDLITADLDFMKATASSREIREFSLRSGDVLITKDSETADDIGVPALVGQSAEGVVCGYHLASLRPTGVHPRFLFWALGSRPARAQFEVSATGVTRFGLTQLAVKSIRIPDWPDQSQRRIADFLDRETARIDALVVKKRRLIDLLEDRFVVVRDKLLVDRPDIEMVPLRHLTDESRPIIYGIVQAGPEVPAGVPYIKTGDVVHLDPGRLSRTDPEIERRYARARVHPGDIVIAMRASIGRAVIVPDDLPWANLTQGTARVAARKQVSASWLFQVLGTHFVQDQFNARAVGSTYRTLNIWDLRRVLIPTPGFEIQRQLAERVTASHRATERLTVKLHRQLTLLAEYREALITAAVTGELDVDTFDGDRGVEKAVVG